MLVLYFGIEPWTMAILTNMLCLHWASKALKSPEKLLKSLFSTLKAFPHFLLTTHSTFLSTLSVLVRLLGFQFTFSFNNTSWGFRATYKSPRIFYCFPWLQYICHFLIIVWFHLCLGAGALVIQFRFVTVEKTPDRTFGTVGSVRNWFGRRQWRW